MKKYVFFGSVFPLRADIQLKNASRSFKDSSGKVVGNIQIDIESSQVLAVLETNITSDLPTLRNVAYSQIRLFLNSCAFILGGGYELDIVKCISLDDGRVETFQPRVKGIVDYISSKLNLNINDVISETNKSEGILLENALEDFSDGLRSNSRNSMFFFYRVFDSLKSFVGAKNSITKETEQWQELRNIISIDREEIDFIKGFADPVRHGRSSEWDVSDIEKAEKLAWDALNKVIFHFKSSAS